MPCKKKNFIDKKNSITFKLVGRSQNDPLFVDETAPQYVLVEKKTHQEVIVDSENSIDKESKENSNRREEQIKYGIYFDDDYDYLQHLIDADEVGHFEEFQLKPKKNDSHSKPKPSIMLPSSVFESTVLEKEDLSKKAALPVGPQLDWDPDVVEAMDDDFDFDDPENQLNDDFVIQAMMEPSHSDPNMKSIPSVFQEELHTCNDSDDNLSMCGYNGSEDEFEEENINKFDISNKKVKKKFGTTTDDQDDWRTAKTSASTHFTEYSISSSVLPRNDNLKTLDQKFERMFIREYADDIGFDTSDEEENVGEIDPKTSKMMEELVQEYENFKAGVNQEYEPNESSINYVRKYLELKAKKEGICFDSEESSCSETEEIEIVDPGRKGDKDRFDCESILSAYSNTSYHPKILKNPVDRYGTISSKNRLIQVDPKTGIPKAPRPINLDRNHQMETKSSKSNMSRLTELSFRPKEETSEEKRRRKKELKEFRAQRRMEKKANRLAFQDEKIRLHKSVMNKATQKKISVA